MNSDDLNRDDATSELWSARTAATYDADVWGIELSPSMIEVLRAKPGGDRVAVTTRVDGTTRSSGRFRYAWPAEYDLMARIAGLQLTGRWAGWDRSPFTATSASHVSVWRRPS